MSEENLEVIRRALAAFKAGDMTRMIADMHPEVVTARAEPDAATWHGPEGFLEALADWTEGFDEWTFEITEMIDSGDHVFTRTAQTAVGAESGVPVRGEFLMVYTFAQGKVIRCEIFLDERAAKAAAGLGE